MGSINTTVLRSFYDPTKTYDENFDEGPFADDQTPYIDRAEPRYQFLGKKIYSPFGIAAGPLLNSRFIKFAFDKGFDVNVYKTQRSVPAKVNAFPNVLYLDIDGDLTIEKAQKPIVGQMEAKKPHTKLSITNSFGNPSKGPAVWVPDKKKALRSQKKGKLLISSVVGTIKPGFSDEDYFNDFAEAAELAAQTGVESIEINLSCPNVANEGILCYTPKSVLSITEKVKAKIGDVPLVVKFGYFSAQQQDLLVKTIKDIAPYISAVSAINTIPAAVVDEDGNQALPGPNRLISGICGASIKWAGLDMVNRLNKMRQKLGLNFEIIGVGGVMLTKDFFEYRQAGADVVQCATAAMWNPNLAAEIKSQLNSNVHA